jgi:translation elongation factor EF-G
VSKILTQEDAQILSSSNDTIRNVCLLGQNGHGTTTLEHAMAMHNDPLYEESGTGYKQTENKGRGPSVASTGKTLIYKHSSSRRDYLINIVRCPNNIDEIASASTSLMVCDGAMLVVDITEGASLQT